MADQHRMPTHHPRIIGTRHMVASANYLAAQAGFEILEAGGNAIDAGVAGGIALGVLQCEYVHFAGVAPIMIHLAETGETVSISGLGPWPKLASRRVVPRAPGRPHPVQHQAQRGAGRTRRLDHRAGTLRHDELSPRSPPRRSDLAARGSACSRFHMRSWRRAPTRSAAGRRTPRSICRAASRRSRASGSSRPIWRTRSSTWRMRKRAARKGGRAAGLAAARDAFYRGDIAQKIVAYHKANDGWLREDDLAEFRVDVETPLAVRFGDIDGVRLPAVVPGAGAAADAEDPRRHRPEGRSATTRRPISIRLSRR